MLHAITHDLTEALTGDLVRTFKYSSPEFKKAVNKAEDDMLARFPSMIVELYQLWDREAGKDKSYVEAVVKAADFMSLHQYMIREVARGNAEINPFLERMVHDLRMEGKSVENDSDPRVASLSDLYKLMASVTTPGQRTA
jgi:5'-deoxynucleotidase YfbR-like HD superfamily hydrolase